MTDEEVVVGEEAAVVEDLVETGGEVGVPHPDATTPSTSKADNPPTARTTPR
jgi:hypothetical protein